MRTASSSSEYRSFPGKRGSPCIVRKCNVFFVAAQSKYANPSDVPIASDGSQYAETAGLFVNDVKSLE